MFSLGREKAADILLRNRSFSQQAKTALLALELLYSNQIILAWGQIPAFLYLYAKLKGNPFAVGSAAAEIRLQRWWRMNSVL